MLVLCNRTFFLPDVFANGDADFCAVDVHPSRRVFTACEVPRFVKHRVVRQQSFPVDVSKVSVHAHGGSVVQQTVLLVNEPDDSGRAFGRSDHLHQRCPLIGKELWFQQQVFRRIACYD